MPARVNMNMRLPLVLVGVPMVALLAGGCASLGPGGCVGASGVAAPQASPAKVLLNTDARGLAIEGYDPVAYFTDAAPVPGQREHRSTFGGATYQFASLSHKQLFDAQPTKYAPQYGGYCAYAASIDRVSPIDPKYWEIVDGRLILQHDQRAWDLWHKDAGGNIVLAGKNWPGLVDRNGVPPRQLINVDDAGLALQGYDPVAYFTLGRPEKGSPDLTRMYQGATYWFVSKANKDLFEADPARHAPEFGGFCGYAASINKISPIDPQYWQLVEGRMVLQHTQKAYDLFNQDVPGNAAKARQNWPGLQKRRCGS